MKTINIFKGFWSVEDVRDNPDCLFVYGDNDIRRGAGGQAVIRHEPNAIGLTTKKLPTSDPGAFFYDEEIEDNVAKISEDINKILREFLKVKYHTLVIPEKGLGTGLSDLPRKAPRTFAVLKHKITCFVELFQPGISRNIKW